VSVVKQAYSRLETDEEYAAHVREKFPWYRGEAYNKGEALDCEVEWRFGIQRRIIWVYP
jgi:hypothetical protein